MENLQIIQVLEDDKRALDDSFICVRVSEDGLVAYIRINLLHKKMKFNQEQIKKALSDNLVVYGIDEEKIEQLVKNQIVNEDVVIAKGYKSVDGKDGRFEYFFNRFISTKPIILEDGSADYSTLGKMERVTKGQIIVQYHEATKGRTGKNVFGEEIAAKDGKELKPLIGSGFSVSEDNHTYISNYDGKIEYKDGKILITNVLVIEGDVDKVSGDVNFSGDVFVKGNVMTGASMHVGGNIHVAGYVEASVLVALKDVILDNGMQGGGKGLIRSGGDVAGKFFEQVAIYAEGKVSSNAIMHCKIVSKDEVVVAGRRGIIIGGSIYALKGVSASIIGSAAEVATDICVGYEKEIIGKILQLDVEIKMVIGTIKKVDKCLQSIVAVLNCKKDLTLIEKKRKLVTTKLELNQKIVKLIKKRENYLECHEKGKDASIVVKKTIYPRVQVMISGSMLKIKDEYSNIRIKRKGIDICLFENET